MGRTKNIQKEEERISAEPALTAEEKSRGLTKEFQRAVQMAGMILENKFARYRADARADAQIEEVLCTGRSDRYKDSCLFRICSVSETAEGDGYRVCYFSVESWRILYPATEETGFHELQMQFPKALAGA